MFSAFKHLFTRKKLLIIPLVDPWQSCKYLRIRYIWTIGLFRLTALFFGVFALFELFSAIWTVLELLALLELNNKCP